MSKVPRNPNAFDVLRHVTYEYMVAMKQLHKELGGKTCEVLTAPSLSKGTFKQLWWHQRNVRAMELLLKNIDERGEGDAEGVMIAAMDPNGVIGKGDELPWPKIAYKEEMDHFRNTTMGWILVVGRKTAESMRGPLPARLMFVVTSQELDQDLWPFQFDSYHMAVRVAAQMVKRVFIAGGRSAYEWGLTYCTRAILSVMNTQFDGDVMWPHEGRRENAVWAGDIQEEALWLPLPQEWDLTDTTRRDDFDVLEFRREDTKDVKRSWLDI